MTLTGLALTGLPAPGGSRFDIIACRITGKGVVAVGDHTHPNTVAIKAEELTCGIRLHGAVTLRKDETGTVDQRVLRSGEVDQRRDRIQLRRLATG